MSISEFSVHNVLRTYSRQEQLGRVQRAKTRSSAGYRTNDQVSLSPTGRKVQWLNQFAAEVVGRQHSELSAEDRNGKVRHRVQEFLSRHDNEIADDRVSPKDFEVRLRSLYLR